LPVIVPRLRREARRARARVRRALWPATQASVAAGLSWYVAHNLLGHPQPFFAPVAALIAVGTVNVQRGQRSLQMAAGVLLGIGVGEPFASLLGVEAYTIAIVAFVTLTIAVGLSVGVFGNGMMFVNQAGASAVLVVALHRTGTGGERLLDAVVGGGVAVLIAVVLFPFEPLGLIRRTEQDLLRTLSTRLAELGDLLERDSPPSQGWIVSTSRSVNQAIARLAQARRDARNAARIAPRRWSAREAVARERARTHNTDLLANTTLNVLRIAADGLAFGETALAENRTGVRALARSLARLAESPQPWPVPLVEQTRADVSRALAAIEPHATPRTPLVASLLREAERDLLLVLAGS
jgi:uncharacterized membrane protein YgaE (UPF0421/DUF939 family)